jgi:pimeloyl-ACP methyl ester carboxylesterase
MFQGFLSLSDGETRAAFVQSLRAVVDTGGQRVNGHDRLYLAARLPTLLVWGERDPVIPVEHARAAHAAMPGSRLEVFPDAGHFPHMDEPERFATVLEAFLAATEPGRLDAATLREQIREGAPLDA